MLVAALTAIERERLQCGEAVQVNQHRYMLCQRCYRPVRVTGWFAGIHLCQPDTEAHSGQLQHQAPVSLSQQQLRQRQLLSMTGRTWPRP